MAEAARVAGIAESTLYRWLADDDFRHELQRLEEEALDAATRRLTALSENALDVIEETLKSPGSLALRLKAAQMALEYLLRLRSLRSLEERLARLEEAYYEEQRGT